MKTARLKTSEEFRHDATATRNRFKKIAVASTATVESKSLVSRNPKEGNEAKNAKGGEIKIKVGDTASSLIGPGDESADAEDSTKAVEPPADVNAKEGDVKAKEAKAPKYDISSGPHPKKIVSALNSYFGKEKHASSPMAQGHDILDMIRSLDISDKDSDETATQSADRDLSAGLADLIAQEEPEPDEEKEEEDPADKLKKAVEDARLKKRAANHAEIVEEEADTNLDLLKQKLVERTTMAASLRDDTIDHLDDAIAVTMVARGQGLGANSARAVNTFKAVSNRLDTLDDYMGIATKAAQKVSRIKNEVAAARAASDWAHVHNELANAAYNNSKLHAIEMLYNASMDLRGKNKNVSDGSVVSATLGDAIKDVVASNASLTKEKLAL